MKKNKKFFLLLAFILLFVPCSTRTNAKSNIYKIYVGDSRLTEMEVCLTEKQKVNCFFVAKRNVGYEWLEETAINDIQEIIDSNPKIKFNIIFELGVNDLKEYTKYIKIYNKIISEKFEEHNLYVVSVNPVMQSILSKQGFKKRTNKEILKFNSKMQESLMKSFNYIDTYDILVNKEGFGTIDGLHYIPYTYERIFELVNEFINK